MKCLWAGTSPCSIKHFYATLSRYQTAHRCMLAPHASMVPKKRYVCIGQVWLMQCSGEQGDGREKVGGQEEVTINQSINQFLLLWSLTSRRSLTTETFHWIQSRPAGLPILAQARIGLPKHHAMEVYSKMSVVFTPR